MLCPLGNFWHLPPFLLDKVPLLPISLTPNFCPAFIVNSTLIIFPLIPLIISLDSEGRNHGSFIHQNSNSVWHMVDVKKYNEFSWIEFSPCLLVTDSFLCCVLKPWGVFNLAFLCSFMMFQLWFWIPERIVTYFKVRVIKFYFICPIYLGSIKNYCI